MTSSPPDLWALYSKIKIVGAGGSGQAVLVRRTTLEANHLTVQAKEDRTVAGKMYVVKRIFLQGETNPKTLQAAAVEVKVLQSVAAHPNVVRYYDHFVDNEGYLDIVMEYCAGGDLDRFLQDRRRRIQEGISGDDEDENNSLAEQEQTRQLTDDQRLAWRINNLETSLLSLKDVLYLSFQLLLAVGHLHGNGVMHRDLKPANVFLQPMDEDDDGGELTDDAVSGGKKTKKKVVRDLGRYTLKVADFGIAHVMQNTVSFAQTVIGTPYYIAPEIAESKPYSTSADVWAAGCIIYELASCGVRCFEGDNMLAVVTKITNGKLRPFPEIMSQVIFKPTAASKPGGAESSEGGPSSSTPSLPPLSAAVLSTANAGVRHGEKMQEFLFPLIQSMVTLDPEHRLSATQLVNTFFLPEAGCTTEGYLDDFEDPEPYE